MREWLAVIRFVPLFGALVALAVLPGPAAAQAPAAPPALPPPQWVGAVVVQRKPQLVWVRNPDHALVRVYRSGPDAGASFLKIAEVGQNSYTDTTVEAPGTYRYRLAGVGRDGREGRPSAAVSVTVAAVVLTPPTPPAWDGALQVEGGVGLKWSAREGEDVIAYNVYRRAAAEAEFKLVGSTQRTNFVDTGLEPGRQYLYVLTALDSAFRETPFSAELPVTFSPPRPDADRAAPAQWRVRRTRLVGLVTVADVPLLRPADVAFGPVTGSVYLSDSGQRRVFVFSPALQFLRSVGAEGKPGSEAFQNVLGIALDAEEHLYAVDAGPGVVRAFDGEGRSMDRTVTVRPEDGGPTGLIDAAFGSDGRLLVVDNFRSRLHLFDRVKEPVVIARPGSGGGEVSAPTFCATGPAGEYVVADALNARVQVFSPAGEFVLAFGGYSREPGGFGRPKGVAVSAAGETYVADSWLNTVQVFDAQGRFVAVLGDERGRPLDLGSPNGIALGPRNRIAIAERLAGRLQVREIVDEGQ